MGEEKGWNADRRGCRTCKYRARPWNRERNNGGCDYILHKKQRRGCSVEHCDKHEKGETKKRRRHIHI